MTQTIRKALVVDDSRLARIALSKQLQKRGIEVETAGNGTEAMQFLLGQRPDVVFMDYMMPDMDGFEATQRILENPECNHPPVIMYTSQDTDEDRARAKAIGIAAFLTKPSTDDGLDQALAVVAAGAPVAAKAPAAPAAPAAPSTPKIPAAPAAAAAAELPWDRIRAAAREAAQVLAVECAERTVREQLEAFRAELEDGLQQAMQRAQSAEETAREGAERVARATAAEVAEQAARQGAQAVAEQVAGKVARQVAPEAARGIADELGESVMRQFEAFVGGAEFRTQIKGIVFEHVLPQIQQVLQPTMQNLAAEAARQAAREVVEEALAERMDTLQAQLAATLDQRVQEQLRAADKRWLVAVLIGGALAAVGIAAAWLL